MSNAPPPQSVTRISECFIKPKHEVEESKSLYNLTPWDLPFLPCHYIQQGLLYTKPPQKIDLLERLEDSLSYALCFFYPLAGMLVTKTHEENCSCSIFVDCKRGPGAKFVHALSKSSIADVLSAKYAPELVHSLFDDNGAINHDAHFRPLLTVQVTELVDGVFIGCSMNHAVVDGTSFWHFFNTWSEIYMAKLQDKKLLPISRRPLHTCWYPDGLCGPIISLPFITPSELITRVGGDEHEQGRVRERVFHFSSESIAKLKAKANASDLKLNNMNKISSFQALVALVWRAVTRARGPHDQEEPTSCVLAANNRLRLNPPLSSDYFGNCMQYIGATTTVNQLLLDDDLGRAASLLNNIIVGHDDGHVENWFKEWVKSPFFYHPIPRGKNSVVIANSPRFDMYGNEFGIGKPIGVRTGFGNKYDGKVVANEGGGGIGSVDLEICLEHKSMAALESDKEFMDVVSSSTIIIQ